MKINSDKIRLMLGDETQESFSEKIGVSRFWFGQLLIRGEASPRMVNKISKGLEVEPKEILISDVK